MSMRPESALLPFLGLLATVSIVLAIPVLNYDRAQTPLLPDRLPVGQPPGFDEIIAFGDSLTDNGGGAWVVTNHSWPSYPGYYQHSFSNGPVYPQKLSQMLGIPLHDHAIGGATTNNTLVQGYTGPKSTTPVNSVLEQVSTYLSANAATSKVKKSLFIVNGGGNNAFFGNVSAVSTVNDLLEAVELLKTAGGRYFLLPTMLARPQESEFTTEVYEELVKRSKEDMSIVVADFFSLFAAILADPESYGFAKELKGKSCLTGVYEPNPGGGVEECGDVSKYIWWDEFHPTGRAHDLMGRLCLKVLIDAGWL